MNQILDRLAKQPLSVKLVALVVLLAATVGLYWQMWRAPQMDTLAKLKKKTDELNLKITENRAIAENYPKFQEEVNILNEQLKQAVALLPNETDVEGILRQLSILAKKTNVDLLFFKPMGQVKRGFYNEIPMDIKLFGTYHDLAIYINQVGKLSRIINIANIVFSPPRVTRNAIMLQLDCRANTFVFSGG